MSDIDLAAVTREYLEAFKARDLDKCVEFFHEDAAVDFQDTVFRGTDAIRDWHKDRFDANLRIHKVESVNVNGDTVEAEIVISSDRLAAWKVKQLNGRVTARFEGAKMKDVKLGAAMTNMFDMLRGEG